MDNHLCVASVFLFMAPRAGSSKSPGLNVFATTVVVYGLFQFNDGPKLEKVKGHLVRWTKGVKAFDGLSRFLI